MHKKALRTKILNLRLMNVCVHVLEEISAEIVAEMLILTLHSYEICYKKLDFACLALDELALIT